MNFNNTYRPLPKSLTIKKSGIDGLGLFAVDDIEISTELGITHINLWDNCIFIQFFYSRDSHSIFLQKHEYEP